MFSAAQLEVGAAADAVVLWAAAREASRPREKRMDFILSVGRKFPRRRMERLSGCLGIKAFSSELSMLFPFLSNGPTVE